MSWKTGRGAYSSGERKRTPRSVPHVTRDRRVARGACIDCGEAPPRTGILRCDECAAKMASRVKAKGKAHNAAGLCAQCSGVLFAARLCERCWFKRISSSGLGHTKGGEMLARKFREQGGRCWYTNRKLTPGVDASVDHTIAVARGGTHEESNLRWVHIKVNEMKRELGEQELYEFCTEIARGLKRPRLL